MSWQQLFVIIGAHFLALLSPGPDFFIVVRNSLLHGRRAGVITSVGIALANGVFIVIAIAGFTFLRDQPFLYGLLYWSGCIYLAWLGLCFWRARRHTVSLPESNDADISSLMKNHLLAGFLSGILNPKNALFYLALFTVLIGRNTAVAWQAICGIWMFFAVFAWDCFVAWSAGHPRIMSKFGSRVGGIHQGSAIVLWLISLGMCWNGLVLS
ncbi:LysE family translocator [Deefgea tanakiae]|uniref:LysE family translocator n=1 Tax=Deefgea tanakiae TaxID=2865840 RepID=A0ABX8Z4H5_9NEIS|nr:LysE family translocator [Deefgea tanakiae]QZA77488.1 LysE family translocator [Deefgea tanakiae]